MKTIKVGIRGVPYGKAKSRGDLSAPSRWTESVIAQTSNLERINGPVKLDVTFLLPPDKYPSDLPFGPDLDNLLKRFQDALNHTIFADVKGSDSSIIEINARKKRVVESTAKAGAYLEIRPVKISRSC